LNLAGLADPDQPRHPCVTTRPGNTVSTFNEPTGSPTSRPCLGKSGSSERGPSCDRTPNRSAVVRDPLYMRGDPERTWLAGAGRGPFPGAPRQTPRRRTRPKGHPGLNAARPRSRYSARRRSRGRARRHWPEADTRRLGTRQRRNGRELAQLVASGRRKRGVPTSRDGGCPMATARTVRVLEDL